jgi:hypothetical protein
VNCTYDISVQSHCSPFETLNSIGDPNEKHAAQQRPCKRVTLYQRHFTNNHSNSDSAQARKTKKMFPQSPSPTQNIECIRQLASIADASNHCRISPLDTNWTNESFPCTRFDCVRVRTRVLGSSVRPRAPRLRSKALMGVAPLVRLNIGPTHNAPLQTRTKN